MNGRFGWKIESSMLVIITLCIIILSGISPFFFGLVLQLLVWITIAYLIFIISPTQLFFGKRHATCDTIFLLAYIFLSFRHILDAAAAQLAKLITVSSTYISFSAGSDMVGVPFKVTAAEISDYLTSQLIPRSTEIAHSAATHLSLARQELHILLVDGTRQVAIIASPSTIDGRLLLYYNTLLDYSIALQRGSLIIGTLLLIGVSIYASKKIVVREPSVLSVFRERGPALALRPFWVFLLAVGFFVMVFDLLFAWTIIVGTTVFLLLCCTLFAASLLTGSFRVELLRIRCHDFSIRCVSLFMKRHTILLGMSGFLVLRLITDMAKFIIPVIFAWPSSLRDASQYNSTLYQMIVSSMGVSPVQNAAVIMAYLLSVAGMILLVMLPAIIWYKIFLLRTSEKNQVPDWSKYQIGFVLGIVSVYFIVPVLSFAQNTGVAAVTILAKPILHVDRAMIALGVAASIVLLCIVIGSINDYFRRVLMLGPFGVTMLFFAVYIYQYFASSFVYYAQLVIELLSSSIYSVAALPMILAIFCFTVFFFISGYFSFLYEMWRD